MSFLSLDRFYKWVVHPDSKLLCVWNVNDLHHFARWFLHLVFWGFVIVILIFYFYFMCCLRVFRPYWLYSKITDFNPPNLVQWVGLEQEYKSPVAWLPPSSRPFRVSRPSSGTAEEKGVESHPFLQWSLSLRHISESYQEKEEARSRQQQQQRPGRAW